MFMKNSESGSDVSSNSSWIVIDDENDCREAKPEPNSLTVKEIDLEVITTTKLVDVSENSKVEEKEFLKVSFSNSSIKSSDEENTENSKTASREDGFLTFDEYLQEHMLEYDYEDSSDRTLRSSLKKSRKCYRGKRKCKAETIGVLSLCASLLTVTGIALLCIIFPESVDNKSFESIKSNYQAIANNDTLNYKNIIASFNRTMDVLDTVNSTKVVAKCANSLMKNDLSDIKMYRRHIGPLTEARSSRYRISRKHENRLPKPKDNNMCYPNEKKDVCFSSENPRFPSETFKKFMKERRKKTEKDTNTTLKDSPTKDNLTNLSTVQKVLGSSSLKHIIRSILHDICMLKLITYFNNSKTSKDSKPKSDKGKKKLSRRKLFEAIADGLTDIQTSKGKILCHKTRRKNKASKIIGKGGVSSLNVPLCLENTNQLSIPSETKITLDNNNALTEQKSKCENGKSECERRFDEIDSQRRKSKEICCRHKLNIQQIKQKYRSDIDAVKESRIEPIMRLSKLQAIRENYRLQLKRNRDHCIKEMAKMKKAQAVMMREEFSRKRNEFGMKDVAVGSYVVPINYDFFTSLKKIKEKESMYSTSKDEFAQEKLAFDEKRIFKPKLDKSRKFLFTQGSPFEYSEKDSKHQPVYSSTLSKISTSDTSPRIGVCLNLDLKKSEANFSDHAEVRDDGNFQRNIVEVKDLEHNNSSDDSADSDHSCLSIRKRNLDHIYELAFEKKSKSIKRSDYKKWSPQEKVYLERWEKFKNNLSKQDPKKTYQPNIVAFKF